MNIYLQCINFLYLYITEIFIKIQQQKNIKKLPTKILVQRVGNTATMFKKSIIIIKFYYLRRFYLFYYIFVLFYWI